MPTHVKLCRLQEVLLKDYGGSTEAKRQRLSVTIEIVLGGEYVVVLFLLGSLI